MGVVAPLLDEQSVSFVKDVFADRSDLWEAGRTNPFTDNKYLLNQFPLSAC